MLLPTKHIKICESILGLGGLLYSLIDAPISLIDLCERHAQKAGTDEFPARHTLEHVSLALDFLFLLGLIDVNDGKIYKTIWAPKPKEINWT